MNDSSPPGPMEMVKIDGAKIKKLREQLGLTQLYLATAVQVTTDTISRWENRRYPSIKKENGLKLAEALGVSLDEILEKVEATNHSSGTKQFILVPEKNGHSLSWRRSWPLILLSAVLLMILGAFAYAWLQQSKMTTPAARRVLPSHCISGQSFPVLIEVTGDDKESSVVLVKENLPGNSTFIAAAPPDANFVKKERQLKWLKKIGPRFTFAYTVVVSGDTTAGIQFAGTCAFGTASGSGTSISGDRELTISDFHWADTNKDHAISDVEILTVYDKYSDLPGLDLNFELLEKIWLSSGYRYNPETTTFDILE